MKKILLPMLFLLISSLHSQGQTSLPYYTGFDNPTEQAGWSQFSTGNTKAYTWFMGASGKYRSPLNAIESPSTEFASATFADTSIQWYVSPPFNFSKGGRIDSFAINVFQAGGKAQTSDSIVLYLLEGSNDPDLAIYKIRLADLTGMARSDYILRDTGNFIIPVTPITSFIAFKYYSVYDWFQATIDNINISGNAITTATGDIDGTQPTVFIYPNPAINEVAISGLSANAEIILTNVLGQRVLNTKISNSSNTLDISQVPRGIYWVEVISGSTKTFIKKLIVEK